MTPEQFQVLALAWLGVITVIVPTVVGVGLVLIKGWSTWRAAITPKVAELDKQTSIHETKLNGLMDSRIAAGAAAAVAAVLPVPSVDQARIDHIAALQAELATLTKP